MYGEILLLNNYSISGASQINSAGTINAVDNLTTVAGGITATTGKTATTIGNTHTSTGSITGKQTCLVFQNLAITGTIGSPLTPTDRGEYIGLYSTPQGD